MSHKIIPVPPDPDCSLAHSSFIEVHVSDHSQISKLTQSRRGIKQHPFSF